MVLMSIGILSIRYGILDFKDVSGIVHCVLAYEYLSLMSPVPLDMLPAQNWDG